jgi:NAD+ synthase
MMAGLHANTDLLRKILVGFVKDEVRKVGVSKIVLGLSGGIDSALVAFIAAEALGPENVHAICMPYKTSNPESEAHARLVATACGINYSIVPITAMVDAYFDMFPDAENMRRGNKMARERMTILFDHSALLRALVLGTLRRYGFSS